jgi:hypothetical protein
MRLRIVRPVPADLEGNDLSHIHFAAVHDLHPPISDLLIVLGYGVPVDEPSADLPVAKAVDRRSIKRFKREKPLRKRCRMASKIRE